MAQAERKGRRLKALLCAGIFRTTCEGRPRELWAVRRRRPPPLPGSKRRELHAIPQAEWTRGFAVSDVVQGRFFCFSRFCSQTHSIHKGENEV